MSKRFWIYVWFMIIMVAVVITALVLLTSCVPATPKVVEDRYTTVIDTGGSHLTRTIDQEAGVVCWTIYQQAIDCLPLSDTKLDISY